MLPLEVLLIRFQWWVPWTLKKSERIIASIISRLKVTTHKYGVKIPTSKKHAKRLDEKNGNTLWWDAYEKEMTNFSIAFKFKKKVDRPPPGYKRSSGHIIWTCKIDFTRKARWVKDGHRTPDPEHSNYTGVVSLF